MLYLKIVVMQIKSHVLAIDIAIAYSITFICMYPCRLLWIHVSCFILFQYQFQTPVTIILVILPPGDVMVTPSNEHHAITSKRKWRNPLQGIVVQLRLDQMVAKTSASGRYVNKVWSKVGKQPNIWTPAVPVLLVLAPKWKMRAYPPLHTVPGRGDPWYLPVFNYLSRGKTTRSVRIPEADSVNSRSAQLSSIAATCCQY